MREDQRIKQISKHRNNHMRSKPTTIIAIMAITLLTSCSGYSSKFACDSSHGAKCVMIADIDKMIDSGEIEEYHVSRKCKGNKKCAKAIKPRLQRS